MGEDKIKEFLALKLGLSDGATFDRDVILHDTKLPIEVDQVIKDRGNYYFVEIKSRGDINSVAQLVLLREWLKEGFPGERRFVVAAKQITEHVKEVGKKMGIEVLELPYGVEMCGERGLPTRKGKMTSEKSWRIVSRLLKERGISIRKLSIEENVSYAWSHATVQNLLSRGIASKKGNYVVIRDIPQLLNGVAWERPFEELFYDEIYVDYENVYQAGKVLTEYLKKHDVPFSFTAYTAAGQYSGYGRRYDTLYMYIEKGQVDKFKKEFETGAGIKLRMYIPDRDVFTNSAVIGGIQVVSLEQVLLDLSGLGYSGRDITKALVDEYGS